MKQQILLFIKIIGCVFLTILNLAFISGLIQFHDLFMALLYLVCLVIGITGEYYLVKSMVTKQNNLNESENYCDSCGKPVAENCSFCPFCGTTITKNTNELTTTDLISRNKTSKKLFSFFSSKKQDELENRIKELEFKLTPEQQDIEKLQNEIEGLKSKKSEIENEIIFKTSSVDKLNSEITSLNSKINSLKNEIIELDDEVLYQSFGLYKPSYNFEKAQDFKEKLDDIRYKQKQMVRNETAVNGNLNWTVNNSITKGRKMVKDTQKLLLRAFNSECDELVSKVKYNNYYSYVERINKACNQISKLGNMMMISISDSYRLLKIEELKLAYEYAKKKQQEKEEQKEIRAQMREEAKLQKEIAEERKKLEKEQTHYLNALAKINAQLSENPDNEDLINKKKELKLHIDDTEKAIKDVDYREANKKAGYVYIISNVGSFGENIYKIGMTRRLDPTERVYELGDASVPFKFDTHAMIFTDDAPALEAKLHKAFEDKKVNMVNQRREFFNVSLDEIKKVIKENFDKTVEWTDIPDAEQYRESLKIKELQN